MTKAIFLAHPSMMARVYSPDHQKRIAAQTDSPPPVISPDRLDDHLTELRDTEVIFSTWGMPYLTEEQLDALPSLRAVFYAAGSVQHFAHPLLERGITVVSAWRANAIPVAEFTLSQILLACKGYFRNLREYTGNQESFTSAFRGPGNYGETIALLGAGATGRTLTGLLRPFRLRVLVYDPFLEEEAARQLGVELVSLEYAFEHAFVVSNHLADKPETAEILNKSLFDRLRPGATFINTGRGRTVNEIDLIQVLQQRPDLTALLDVTDPEPAVSDSPLFFLPNALVTSHIAGSINDEVQRLAEYSIEEFERYIADQPLQHNITLEMLAALT